MSLQVKVTEQEIKLSQEQRDWIDTKIKMGLARFAQLISVIELNVTFNHDSFEVGQITCELDVVFYSGEKLSNTTSALKIDEALTNSVQRVRRALDRKRKNASMSASLNA